MLNLLVLSLSPIITENLELHIVDPSHVRDIFALESDARVVKYFGKAPMQSMDEATQWIRQRCEALTSESGITWTILKKDEQRVIGTCSFYGRNVAFQSAACGYELLPDYWGRGLMKEALIEMLHYGFQSMLLNRVTAGTATDNIASIKLLERVGFQREGLLRQYWLSNDKFDDAYTYALLAEDWHALHPSKPLV